MLYNIFSIELILGRLGPYLFILESPNYSSRCETFEYPPLPYRRTKAMRLWCLRRTYQFNRSHIRRHKYIYVARTNSRIVIHGEKRCLELGHNLTWAWMWACSMGKVCLQQSFLTLSGNGGVLELLQQIVNEPPPKLPPGEDYQGLDTLIERCLVKDPDERPRPEELMVCTLSSIC